MIESDGRPDPWPGEQIEIGDFIAMRNFRIANGIVTGKATLGNTSVPVWRTRRPSAGGFIEDAILVEDAILISPSEEHLLRIYKRMQENPPVPTPEEAFYLDEVLPALRELGAKCQARKLMFLAAVEYEPGQLGRFVAIPDSITPSLDVLMVKWALTCNGDLDTLVIGANEYAKEHPLQSSILKLLQPSEPAENEGAAPAGLVDQGWVTTPASGDNEQPRRLVCRCGQVLTTHKAPGSLDAESYRVFCTKEDIPYLFDAYERDQPLRAADGAAVLVYEGQPRHDVVERQAEADSVKQRRHAGSCIGRWEHALQPVGGER